MSTPHINAEKGDFAETVLMPGDPYRAEFIAKNFLGRRPSCKRCARRQRIYGHLQGKACFGYGKRNGYALYRDIFL